VYMGYGYLGHFTSWDQIWNSSYFVNRSTVIGNYNNEDWNGDGVVDGKDVHPIQFNQNPWLNFSFNFQGYYRRFDLTFQFQGSALGSLMYGEQTRGDASTLTFMLDRYHPLDPKADPYNPATQWVSGYYQYGDARPLGFNANGANGASAFIVPNNAFVRLKTLELGYSLPDFRGCNLRLYVSTYNLFTISGIRNVDPEHPSYDSSTWGYVYPLNKSFSVGLNLKF